MHKPRINNFGNLLAALAASRLSGGLAQRRRFHQIGPGQKSILKIHERVIKQRLNNPTLPHQGKRECARRARHG